MRQCPACNAALVRRLDEPNRDWARRRYCSRTCQKTGAGRSRAVGPFWDSVTKSSGCWEWTGWRDRLGYGRLRFERQWIGAHRAAWILTNGPIPPGLFVLHHCDNPPCCNPAHLHLGTARDNTQDMIAHGRLMLNRPSGERRSDAKLTEAQVRDIRARFRPYVVTRAQLAREYGVSPGAIKHVVNRSTWRHVD